MSDSGQLEEMSRMKIDKIDRHDLIDIDAVKIDPSLPTRRRMKNYVEQIKNPYCFTVGKTPVQISFKPCGKELGALLESYFLNLKNG